MEQGDSICHTFQNLGQARKNGRKRKKLKESKISLLKLIKIYKIVYQSQFNNVVNRFKK